MGAFLSEVSYSFKAAAASPCAINMSASSSRIG